MARNKEEQARLEGMAQALRIAREKGIEGLEEEIRETMCDEYCKYPYICPDQRTLDNICGECELAKLFEALS